MYFCNVDSADSAAGGQFIYMGWSFVFLYTSFRLFSSRIHTSVTIFPLGRVYQSLKNVFPKGRGVPLPLHFLYPTAHPLGAVDYLLHANVLFCIFAVCY